MSVPTMSASDNPSEHPPQVELSSDELTLHLIASGLSMLVQSVTDGHPLSVPYPPALQRGLDRLVVACLRQSQTPPRSVVELIDWCRKPLSSWPLALPADAIGPADTLLISDFPTRICDGWACAKPDVEAELGEQHLIRSVFQTCMEANNTTAYTAFRSLLIQHPVLTAFEFQQHMMRPELDILREHIRAAYAPAPVATIVQEHYHCCGNCGNLLLHTSTGNLECEDERCRGNSRIGRTIPAHDEVVWLKRGLRRFVAAPGRVEIALAEELERMGVQVELWPEFDRYDVRITFPNNEVWAIDVKDWANPFLLARSVRPIPRQPPWDRAFFVVPDERKRQRQDYLRAFQNYSHHLDRTSRLCFVSQLIGSVRKKLKGMT